MQAEPPLQPQQVPIDSCPKVQQHESWGGPSRNSDPWCFQALPQEQSIPQVKNAAHPSKINTKSRGKNTPQERTFQREVVDIALPFSLLCITDVSIVREALKQPPLLPRSARGNSRLWHLPPAHQIQAHWAERRGKIAPNCSAAALIPCDQPAKNLIATSARKRQRR